jgi:hypothetical protein
MGVVALAAALPGGAGAQDGGGGEFAFDLSSRRPAAPTGLSLSITYRHPQNPDAKPPALEEVALAMPRGLRLDTGVVPSCEASNEELRALGRGACPSESRVGAGTLLATTGFPDVDPVETDLTVFNGGDELIELVSFKGTDTTAGYDRLKIDGERLVADPPATPGGPPDGRTTVRRIEFTIEQRTSGSGASRRSFLTTPPECPATGAWTSRAEFKFAGYEAQHLTDETPCSSSPTRQPLPRMRLAVSPRRAPVGAAIRFRVRVRSAARSCRRRVEIELGGKRAQTGARGRAAVTTELGRPGRRAVRATKEGCRSARAWVRAVD